jgi:hypothetical protein
MKNTIFLDVTPCCLLLAGFLLELLLDSEDGGSMFLQNFGEQRMDKAQNKAMIMLYGKLYYITFI